MKRKYWVAAAACFAFGSAWATEPGDVTWEFFGRGSYTLIEDPLCDGSRMQCIPSDTEIDAKTFTLTFPFDYSADYFIGTPGASPEVTVDVVGGMLMNYTVSFDDNGNTSYLHLTSIGGIEHNAGSIPWGQLTNHYVEDLTYIVDDRSGPSALPEPGVAWMLATGLAGLALRKRWVASSGGRG